jgi:hypothetical protein
MINFSFICNFFIYLDFNINKLSKIKLIFIFYFKISEALRKKQMLPLNI